MSCLTFFSVNANIDMVVSAIDLLEALNVSITSPKEHPYLNSLTELEQVVSFSMLHCAGMERVFLDQQLFIAITDVARSIPHEVK